MLNPKALMALARAYDKEDAAQRGEPDPWNLDDPGDIGDSENWIAERIACAEAGITAYLAHAGEPVSNYSHLISIIADIRMKSGVGAKPMLSELADAIAARIAAPQAQARVKGLTVTDEMVVNAWNAYWHERWNKHPADSEFRMRSAIAAILYALDEQGPSTPVPNATAQGVTDLDADRARKWPALKKAIWDVVTFEQLNDGHYINAYDLTDKLYFAAEQASLSAPPTPADGVVSPTDPLMILAGIKQFGLASDGSDLRDLEAAIHRLKAAPADERVVEALREKIEEIRSRVEKTICPTFSSDGGDKGEQGRISRSDFDTLILAALAREAGR